MKKNTIEIERWDMDEFIETIVERVNQRISVDVNCEDLIPCLPCEAEWLTTMEVLKVLKISRPTLDRMRKDNKITFRQVGRGYRYKNP
jgi:excisionase family DNA binding protein